MQLFLFPNFRFLSHQGPEPEVTLEAVKAFIGGAHATETLMTIFE